MRKAHLLTVLVAGALLAGSTGASAASKKAVPAPAPAAAAVDNSVIERVTQLPDPNPPMPAMQVVPLQPSAQAWPGPAATLPIAAPVPPPAPVAPPPPPPPPVKVPVWVAPEGAQLRAVLNAWAEESGWKLVWNTEYGYTLRASVEFEGTFEKASEALIEAFANAKPPIFADFNEGNRVIVVSTPRDQDTN